MIKKMNNFKEALDAIEELDQEIKELLKHDDQYAQIMKLMQKRLVIISEIMRLKDNNEVSQEITERIKKIFDSVDSVQEIVKKKRDKVKARLDKNKRLEIKNKKMNY